MRPLAQYILLLLSFQAFAQQFTTSSDVYKIETSGIYCIGLTPEFRCNADLNLGGIRVHDGNGKEVPYVFMTAEKYRNTIDFKKHPMLLKRSLSDSLTQVFVQNLSGAHWHEITLAIAATDAVKTYNIKGSYDNAAWFSMVDYKSLDGLSSHTDAIIYKTLPLPDNNYKYFKIEFEDRKNEPLNITEAGIIEGNKMPVSLTEIANAHVKVTQMLLEKQSRITVTFNELAIINQIGFIVKSADALNRKATLYVQRSKKVDDKTITSLEPIETFNLNLSGKNTLTGLDLIEKKIVIDIDNGINEPLEISSVRLSQLPVVLVANLKAGEKYKILGGDAQLAPAEYDVKDIKNKLTTQLPVATISKPEKLTGKPKGLNANKSPWVMWACIAIGAVILAYFSFSLLRDIKSNKNG